MGDFMMVPVLNKGGGPSTLGPSLAATSGILGNFRLRLVPAPSMEEVPLAAEVAESMEPVEQSESGVFTSLSRCDEISWDS